MTVSLVSCTTNMDAYSVSGVREDTRFLTDKMAYELNLSTAQYNDVYEINYDFIYNVRNLMDDVLHGSEWALGQYYNYLDTRNDDLRWVLNNNQYARLVQIDYFFRPIYASGSSWYFRVYSRYPDRYSFYFSRPYNYRTYRGRHYRTYYNNESYYRGRYDHPLYGGSYRIRGNNSFDVYRRSDFGTVRVGPNSERRPGRDDVYTTRRSEGSRERLDKGNNTRDDIRRGDRRVTTEPRPTVPPNTSRPANTSRPDSPNDVRRGRNGDTDDQSSSVRSRRSSRGDDNSSSVRSVRRESKDDGTSSVRRTNRESRDNDSSSSSQRSGTSRSTRSSDERR